ARAVTLDERDAPEAVHRPCRPGVASKRLAEVTGGGGEQLGVELGFGEVVPPRRIVRIGTRRRAAPLPGTGEQCRVSLRLAPEGVDASGLVADLRPRGQQLASLAGVG